MLKIDQLCKNFGDNQVLKDLDLEIQDGSIFGLVGVNGAGKSTLLRMIAGVYEPEQGMILLNGSDTYEDEKIRKEIAFVSDEQYYPIGSTIKSVKTLYECMYDFDNEMYSKLLNIFQLEESMSILNLSKGNKRRVSLLFALSIQPKLLLLDEAYDGLEPLIRLKFKKLLIELIDEENIIVIISSHNLKELEDICDSFGILEDGKMLSYGDLSSSKEEINKYQVVFNDIQDDGAFNIFDILHKENEGRVYKLVIKGNEDEVKEKLNSLQPILIDVLPVNFEELFIYELEGRSNENENQ